MLVSDGLRSRDTSTISRDEGVQLQRKLGQQGFDLLFFKFKVATTVKAYHFAVHSVFGRLFAGEGWPLDSVETEFLVDAAMGLPT